MDRIFLRDLRLSCTIGVNDWEREVQQTVKVDLDLELDLAEAGRKDDLLLTVDYKAVRDRIEEVVAQSSFLLVEALAERIAQVCLENAEVCTVRVWVEKPGALRAARTVGVEIIRDQVSGVRGQGPALPPPSGKKPA
jgi:FolB domain-containing protein